MRYIVLPCPFCGKLDSLEFIRDDTTGNVQINCNAVKDGCGMCSGFKKNFEDQTNYWNTRHAHQITIDSRLAQEIIK